MKSEDTLYYLVTSLACLGSCLWMATMLKKFSKMSDELIKRLEEKIKKMEVFDDHNHRD